VVAVSLKKKKKKDRHMKEGTGDAAEGIANSDKILAHVNPVSYTHLTLPTIYSV